MTAIAVLGCGVIGSSWVDAFTVKGHSVRVWDPNPDAVGLVQQARRGNIQYFLSPEAAVEGAEFIQESGPEDIEAKRSLFKQISEALDRHAIVASSTSTLRPSQIQIGLDFAERILVGHPFNPPHILPLVEVVGGAATTDWAVDKAMAFYSDLGKHPIRLRRERPGHLANRLQAALWREAVDAVASGQASVEDVDAAVTLALGPRWALMGPFATFHLGGGQNGLAHFLEHLGRPFEALWDDAHRPSMTDELKQHLVRAVSELLGGRSLQELTSDRDLRLRSILSIARKPL